MEEKKLHLSKLEKEFREFVTIFAEKKTPKSVLDFFKNHSEYVKTTNSIRINGKGVSNLNVSLTKALPSVSPNCYYQHIDLTDSEVKEVKKLYDLTVKTKKYNNDLWDELEAAILSLKTYANIEKELPEAAAYLPSKGLSVIINTTELRKKIK